jgi:hypothetical protein
MILPGLPFYIHPSYSGVNTSRRVHHHVALNSKCECGSSISSLDKFHKSPFSVDLFLQPERSPDETVARAINRSKPELVTRLQRAPHSKSFPRLQTKVLGIVNDHFFGRQVPDLPPVLIWPKVIFNCHLVSNLFSGANHRFLCRALRKRGSFSWHLSGRFSW